MIKQKYIELMNQEIDGVNTASESRQLAEYLKTDSELRQYFHELEGALQIFEQVDPLEAPSHLSEAVREAVDALNPAPAVRRVPVKTSSGWRSFFKPVGALSFATGALFGLILFAGFNQYNNGTSPNQPNWIQGTATSQISLNTRFRDVGPALSLPGLSGQVSVLARDPGTLIRLKIRADERVLVRFNYLEPVFLAGYQATYANAYLLNSTKRSAELEHQGDGEYFFLFSHPDGSDAEIELELQATGGRSIVLSVPVGDLRK